MSRTLTRCGVLTAAALVAISAGEPAYAVPRQRVRPVASRPPTPAELCQHIGTEAQCSCFASEIRANAAPEQVPYIYRYMRIFARSGEEFQRTANAYQRQRPLTGATDAMMLSLTYGAAISRWQGDQKNEIAKAMGGAEPFYKMEELYRHTSDECSLGSSDAPDLAAYQAHEREQAELHANGALYPPPKIIKSGDAPH